MEIVPIFKLPNTKLLAIKYDGQKRNAYEKLEEQWQSTDYLRKFFLKFKDDYFKEYGKRDLANLVKDSKRLSYELFERLKRVAQNSNSIAKSFKPLDNRESEGITYEFQKLKTKGEERKSYLRIYAIKYRDSIIVTGGAIKLIKEMKKRPHTKSEINKLELVRKFLEKDSPDLISGYLDIK